MEATIVKLGPSDKLVGVVSFEEAFGEHSELRGRGRARRQKRRMKRISDRSERKKARQTMRKDQQSARQERKDIRKTRRVARKAMGDQEDEMEDPNSVDQQDQVQPNESYDQGYSDTEYTDAPAEDQGYAEESSEETEEEGPVPYDFETGEYGADGEESSEARGGRRGGNGKGRRSARRANRQNRRAERKAPPVAVEEAEQVADQEMEESFDGEGLSNATGAPAKEIHPQIKDHTKRIVWNKEALRRHRANHARYSNEYSKKMQMPVYRSKPNHPHVVGLREAIQRHDMEIQKHEERLTALERTLAEKFAGHPHIEHGYKLANIELQKQIEGARTAQTKATIKDTIVDKGLDAEIGSQRIDVPAQPEMRTIELSSNASGDVSKGMSTPTKLLIGAAALGLAYYFAKKYKVI